MDKTSKIISLKKKRLEKRYKKLIVNNKYFIIFLGLPLIISSILTIDKYFVKSNLERKGIDYNPYANINMDYISSTGENEFKDIKKYYIYKESINNYLEKRKENIMKY